MKKSIALLALVLSLTPVESAESIRFTGAIVHTVSGATLSPGEVLVRDGKIVAVGATVDGAGAAVVDLKGLHLFPGLIAANTSLGLTEISSVRATQDTTEVGAYSPDVRAWTAVNPDSELLPVARANGITHFQVTPMGGTVAGHSAVMALTGWSTEEMTIKKPVALHLFWPSMNLSTTPRELARDKAKWKSPEDQSKDRLKKLKEVSDFFDEAHAYAKARPASAADAGYTPAWEAMQPMIRGEIPLVIHADSLAQIKSAVTWATARKYKLILAGGRDAAKAADLLAQHQVPVIFESVWEHPIRDGDAYDFYYKSPEVLRAAGVKVIFSEGLGARGATDVRNVPYAAAQAMAFGLPEAEALKGITLYPAQILGVADRLGSIEAGKDATFFVADGNILDLRAGVKRMWIGGKEAPLDSRHTRLYEKYKGRPVGK
jgi:imidazolonepropionase-like amidohydrolase